VIRPEHLIIELFYLTYSFVIFPIIISFFTFIYPINIFEIFFNNFFYIITSAISIKKFIYFLIKFVIIIFQQSIYITF